MNTRAYSEEWLLEYLISNDYTTGDALSRVLQDYRNLARHMGTLSAGSNTEMIQEWIKLHAGSLYSENEELRKKINEMKSMNDQTIEKVNERDSEISKLVLISLTNLSERRTGLCKQTNR